MKSNLIYKCILAVFILILSNQGEACPMCTIHNYMYSSIQNSSDIYVVSSPKRKSKKAVIIKVLRGKHKVGEKILAWNCSMNSKHSLVYCEPDGTSMGLYFGVYDEKDIQEIEWIVKGDSLLRSDQDALAGITGISYEYSSLAIQYIKENYERLLSHLIHTADSLNQRAFHNMDEVDYFEWKIKNLHHAIFKNSNKTVNEYINRWISIYTEENVAVKTKIKWYPLRPYAPAGSFFLSLLGESEKQDSSLSKSIVLELQKRIPTLGEEAASSVFFALMQSGNVSPTILKENVRPEHYDAFALALFHAASQTSPLKKEYYTLALQYVHNKELKDRMEYLLK